MKKKHKKVAIVTGASSGIGLSTAKFLAGKGYTVYGVARRPFEVENVNCIPLDVTNHSGVKELVADVISKEGQIDVLVNNAGMGISGAVENTEIEKAEKIFNINYFGALYFCQSVIPHMRSKKYGRIINMCSVASLIGIPFQSFYSSTKAALLALTESLRSELKPFNIKACAILPGDVHTGFTDARVKNKHDAEVYGQKIKKSVGTMEKDERNGMKPEKVAKAVYKQIKKRNPCPQKVVGFKYKILAILIKFFPRRFVLWAVNKIY